MFWTYEQAGALLRLLECCHLRVKDVDFATSQIVIRNGKDRGTMLPAAVKAALTTMICTPVLNRGPAGGRSPANRMDL